MMRFLIFKKIKNLVTVIVLEGLGRKMHLADVLFSDESMKNIEKL